VWCPRQDSNLRHRLRRPVLYPLSYGGVWWGIAVRAPVDPLDRRANCSAIDQEHTPAHATSPH
jgi:hypothetical protein